MDIYEKVINVPSRSIHTMAANKEHSLAMGLRGKSRYFLGLIPPDNGGCESRWIKIRAACVIAHHRKTGEVMLVREGRALDFPGGCVEKYDDTPQMTAFRELLEEAFGFKTHPTNEWKPKEWAVLNQMPPGNVFDDTDEDELMKMNICKYQDELDNLVANDELIAGIYSLVNNTNLYFFNNVDLGCMYYVISIDDTQYELLRRQKNVVFIDLKRLNDMVTIPYTKSGGKLVKKTYKVDENSYTIRSREKVAINWFMQYVYSRPSRRASNNRWRRIQ